jgi:hypothetical protein
MLKSKAMKWVKALRSGKYKQTKRMLYKPTTTESGPEGYCCLGVLGCISGFKNEDLKFAALLEDRKDTCGVRWGDGSPLNLDGFGKRLKFKVKGELKSFDSLAEANDKGVSFKQIASWIEKNYELL